MIISQQTKKRGGDESTWKIIQNDDSKDYPKSWKHNELQINRQETKIEKVQEMFRKDIEEIKKGP